MQKNFKNNGFTLIELLAIISIVAFLTTIGIVAFTAAREKARITKGLQFSQSVNNALGSEAAGIWGFDQGLGTTALDGSGNGRNGTLINGPVWKCASENENHTPSGQGCSLQLDGSNDYVLIADQPNLTSITFLAWVKFDQIETSVQNYIASNARDCCGVYNGFDFRVLSNKKMRLNIWNSGNSTLDGLTDINANTWYFLGFSYNGSETVLYNNGLKERSAKNAIGLGNPPSFNLAIGAMGFSPASYNMKGYIDDVRIYGQVLGSAQVKKLYYAGLDNLLTKGLIDEKEYQDRMALK